MRYQGTDTSMMILARPGQDFKSEFLQRHLQEFNFNFPEDRSILIDDIRVRGVGKGYETATEANRLSDDLTRLTFVRIAIPPSVTRVVFFKGHGSLKTPVYILDALPPGSLIPGPAIFWTQLRP